VPFGIGTAHLDLAQLLGWDPQIMRRRARSHARAPRLAPGRAARAWRGCG
jgi:hypothetical protein